MPATSRPPLPPSPARRWLFAALCGLATSAQAGEGLRVPDAASVWPQWQLRLSRPQDPVGAWRHEAWWGSAGASASTTVGTAGRAAGPRLTPAADTRPVAVAQSSL